MLASALVLSCCALQNLPEGDFDEKPNLGAMGLDLSDLLTLCFLLLPPKDKLCHLDLGLNFLVIYA